MFPVASCRSFRSELTAGCRTTYLSPNTAFGGETSGWSTTQTVNLSQASSTTPTLEPTATSTPEVPFSFFVAAFIVVVVAVLAIALFFYFRKNRIRHIINS